MVNIDITYKTCSRCGEVKPATTEFYYKNKSASDGLFPYCIDCNKKKTKTWRKDNPDKHKKLYLKRNSTPKQQESMYEGNKKRRETGEYRKWQQNNTDKTKGYNLKRAHKNHDITDKEWLECKEYFNFECAYCGISEALHKELHNQQLHKEHVDHSGSNGIDNCVPSCKHCNSSKHTYHVDEWYTKQEFYNIDKLYKIIKWLDTQLTK